MAGASLHAPDDAPAITEKSLRVAATDFRSRLANAMRRRFSPNTALQPKQLIAEIGVTERTVRAWLAMENNVSGQTLADLQAYFLDRGDLGFIGQVIGRDLEMIVERRAAMRAQAIFMRAMKELEEAAT